MNPPRISYVRSLVSVLGLVVVIGTLALFLLQNLKVSELAYLVLGLIGTVAFGAFSVYFAAAGRKFQKTPRVFISYERADASLAQAVRDRLHATGVEVWFDRDQLRPGDNWRSAIERAISDADTLILLASGDVGDRIHSELQAALRHGVRVVPVITRGNLLPEELRDLHAIDLRDLDPQKVAEEVVASL